MNEPRNPLVTVVVPCYENGADLPGALESLLAQTFENFEILVIDDGSAWDPVVNVPIDPRIDVEFLPENRGYGSVTNHAIGRARGEWVTFVDADDRVVPTYLERMLAAARVHDADMVIAPIMAVRDGRDIGALRFRADAAVLSAREAFQLVAYGDLVLSQHVLMRHPVAEAQEDFAYSDIVYALDHLSRCRRVAVVSEPLYRYTIHAASTTGTLRTSVWELSEVPRLVYPAIQRLFDPVKGAQVRRDLERHMLTQMLHKAAREGAESPLRREIYAWCRRRIGPRDILAAARRRDLTTAGSWMLALLCARLHSPAYRAYDRHKGRPRRPRIRGARTPCGSA